MTTPNLAAEGPIELLDRPLYAYSKLIRSIPELDEHTLEAIDYAVRGRVTRLLTRAAGIEELREAYDDLRGLVPPAREHECGVWVDRWLTLADLLDGRIQALDTRDPVNLARCPMARRVFCLVLENPGLSQDELIELIESLGRTEIPRTRIRALGRLEAHEWIERRGRDRVVWPGRLAAEGRSMLGC